MLIMAGQWEDQDVKALNPHQHPHHLKRCDWSWRGLNFDFLKCCSLLFTTKKKIIKETLLHA
jgi:hypothetical protein